jgi:chromosome segregation ATPase
MTVEIRTKLAQANEYLALNNFLYDQNATLKQDIQNISNSNKKKINALYTDKNKLTQRIGQHEANIAALKEERTELFLKAKNLTSGTGFLISDIQTLQKQVFSLNNKNVLVNLELKNTTADNLLLTTKVETLSAEVQRIGSEEKLLSTEVATITLERNVLAENLVNLQQDNELLQLKNADLEFEIHNLNDAIIKLHGEMEKLKHT